MKPALLPQPLRGIIPPLVTPLTACDALDIPGLERLVEHILEGGVHGLFLLGTTGEGTSLSYRLRRELIERVCRQVAERVPVLVGITDTAFIESVHVAQFAAEKGATALVLAPPYYIPEAQPELREYLTHLLPELPLPVYLYNMPSLTKVTYALETIQWAMDHPKILGVKDSSADMVYFHHLLGLLDHRPDWTVLMGPEELLAESMLMGGHGGVSGGANILPQLYVNLFHAAAAAHLDRVRHWHRNVLQVTELYRVGRHPSAVIKGIKCALSCLGICSDFMAEPFHRFRANERDQIQRQLNAVLAANSPEHIIDLGNVPD